MNTLVISKTACNASTGEPIDLWQVDGKGRDCQIVCRSAHYMGYAKIRFSGSVNTGTPRIYWCRIIEETETEIRFQPVTKQAALSGLQLEQERGLPQ